MIIGVEAGVDNPIQIEVEIIKLYAIRVWQGGVDALSFIFSSFNHNVWVLDYQPPIERRHTHLSFLSLSLSRISPYGSIFFSLLRIMAKRASISGK
jgi:hypothetical protein